MLDLSWRRNHTNYRKGRSRTSAFGCKFFIHNNGKINLGKFDPKSDEDSQQSTHASHESTIEAKNINVLREWRHNASFPNDFIIYYPNEKMQTRASLKKQESVALISQMEPKSINEALDDES